MAIRTTRRVTVQVYYRLTPERSERLLRIKRATGLSENETVGRLIDAEAERRGFVATTEPASI
ncbi:MAG: hypothetical protein V2A73_16665 [Pseudomonadota bacterium]